MNLYDLEVYRLAKRLSSDAWVIYSRFNADSRRIMGYQFVQAADSVGANIAEGFGRFHYLDKNKFNLNARGSLSETRHWIDLCLERKQILPDEYKKFCESLDILGIKLNNYIASTRRLAKS